MARAESRRAQVCRLVWSPRVSVILPRAIGAPGLLGRAWHIRPVDRVVIAYNVLLAFIWALAWQHAPARASTGWLMALVHVALAAAASVVGSARGRVGTRVASLVALVVDLYPLGVLAATWAELGPLISIFYRHTYDLVDLWLDQLVFGTHWHLRWIAAMPWRWLAALMYGAYFSLYPLLVGVPAVLLVVKNREALRDYVFSITLVHLVCFAIYLSFPVLGPWQFGSHGDMPPSLFYMLSAAVQHAGDSLGTACPSTHVAGAATVAFVAWRRFPRAWAAMVTVDAVLISLATVYTQNHYAFNALTGLLVVLVLQGVAAPMLNGHRWTMPRLAIKRSPIQPVVDGSVG